MPPKRPYQQFKHRRTNRNDDGFDDSQSAGSSDDGRNHNNANRVHHNNNTTQRRVLTQNNRSPDNNTNHFVGGAVAPNNNNNPRPQQRMTAQHAALSSDSFGNSVGGAGAGRDSPTDDSDEFLSRRPWLNPSVPFFRRDGLTIINLRDDLEHFEITKTTYSEPQSQANGGGGGAGGTPTLQQHDSGNAQMDARGGQPQGQLPRYSQQHQQQAPRHLGKSGDDPASDGSGGINIAQRLQQQLGVQAQLPRAPPSAPPPAYSEHLHHQRDVGPNPNGAVTPTVAPTAATSNSAGSSPGQPQQQFRYPNQQHATGVISTSAPLPAAHGYPAGVSGDQHAGPSSNLFRAAGSALPSAAPGTGGAIVARRASGDASALGAFTLPASAPASTSATATAAGAGGGALLKQPLLPLSLYSNDMWGDSGGSKADAADGGKSAADREAEAIRSAWGSALDTAHGSNSGSSATRPMFDRSVFGSASSNITSTGITPVVAPPPSATTAVIAPAAVQPVQAPRASASPAGINPADDLWSDAAKRVNATTDSSLLTTWGSVGISASAGTAATATASGSAATSKAPSPASAAATGVTTSAPNPGAANGAPNPAATPVTTPPLVPLGGPQQQQQQQAVQAQVQAQVQTQQAQAQQMYVHHAVTTAQPSFFQQQPQTQPQHDHGYLTAAPTAAVPTAYATAPAAQYYMTAGGQYYAAPSGYQTAQLPTGEVVLVQTQQPQATTYFYGPDGQLYAQVPSAPGQYIY